MSGPLPQRGRGRGPSQGRREGEGEAAPTYPLGPPTLAALFRCFLRLGAMSFGGGMSAWIRLEVVQKRGWIDENQFLSGLALCQIAPGPNAVNLAVFIGTTLLGAAGAVAALLAMLAVPIAILFAAGYVYFTVRALPQGAWFGTLLAGAGAAAIGLTLANGMRLTRRGVRDRMAWAIMLVTAVAVGVLQIPLLWTLAGAIPASLLLTPRRKAGKP
jgi:chromate transporter